VALSLLLPVLAVAELTPDEYIARVEPICKANTLANKQIFSGAKGEVQAGKLSEAARRFKRAHTVFEKTIAQIKRVPQPAEAEAPLGKWIGYLEVESALIARIGAALGDGDKYKAQNLSVRLNRNSNLANNAVLSLDFDYCLIDPARFS
jgi:hypothetical protein